MEQLTETIFPERQLTYATFWARFVANIVDGFFILMSLYMVSLFLGRHPIAGVVDLLILFLYAPLMEACSRQATLGKTGMRIKVTNLDGSRITYGQAFGRHFGKLVSASIAFAGFLMMLGNSRHQTLHDKMAGTQVIKDE